MKFVKLIHMNINKLVTSNDSAFKLIEKKYRYNKDNETDFSQVVDFVNFDNNTIENKARIRLLSIQDRFGSLDVYEKAKKEFSTLHNTDEIESSCLKNPT